MKYIILLVTSVLFSSASYAGPGIAKKIVPKFTLGVKAGVNMQQISGDLSGEKYNAGFVGGLFAGVTKNKIGVQIEGLIKSAKVDYKPAIAATTATIKTVSLDIPIMFEYKLFWHVWLQAGPQFSSIISFNSNNSAITEKNLNTTNFDGLVGLQANLPARISVGARYVLGLTDMNKSVPAATQAWNSRSIQLSVGFRFL